MSTTSASTSVDELRFRLRGGLHEPGDPAYADACALNNAMIDRRPAFVARCAAPDDVIAALAFARHRGLPIAVRGGGHSVAGWSLVDDVQPYATGEAYGNFIGDEGDARVRAGFGAANHDRLAALKAPWDPGSLFHANQNVRPAPAQEARRAA